MDYCSCFACELYSVTCLQHAKILAIRCIWEIPAAGNTECILMAPHLCPFSKACEPLSLSHTFHHLSIFERKLYVFPVITQWTIVSDSICRLSTMIRFPMHLGSIHCVIWWTKDIKHNSNKRTILALMYSVE